MATLKYYGTPAQWDILPQPVLQCGSGRVLGGRRVVPDDHTPRPTPHGGQPGSKRRGQREGRSTDAGTRQSLDDAGRVRRPVR
jgi:hypothetical protein